MKKIRKIGQILLIGGLALGIAACGKAEADDYSTGFVSYEEIQDEFEKTSDKLSWPDGYEVPEKIDSEKDDASYQKGFGSTRASLYWESAWEKELLETYKTGPVRAERALEELEKAKDMAYMSEEKCDDATRQYFAKILEMAKNGEPSGFEENIKLNSPE